MLADQPSIQLLIQISIKKSHKQCRNSDKEEVLQIPPDRVALTNRMSCAEHIQLLEKSITIAPNPTDFTCRDNGIVAICMPAQSSHLLRPLDVGCFGPLKQVYRSLVEQRMRLGYNHIDRFNFLKAYPTAHQEVFKLENIQNGFAATGIAPFKPEMVLDQLHIHLCTRLDTPPALGSQPSNSTLATPHNIQHLGKQASSLKKFLTKGSQSPSRPSKEALEKLIKGCEIALYNAALLAKENHDLRLGNEKEKQKRKRSKRPMTPNESLSVQEATDLI
jgi:hypothetical protein